MIDPDYGCTNPLTGYFPAAEVAAFKAVKEMEKYLPELEAEFTGKDEDFAMPLGDNWLAAWNWAGRLAREHDIDPQAALRVARDRYPFG